MIGDGAARADHSRLLYDELRAIRQSGLTRISEPAVPLLREAAQAVHGISEMSAGEAVRQLVLHAIEQLGDGPESTMAAQALGVAPGMRMWSAADRRKAAARTQGVSVERFRHGYEPQLLQLVADEIVALVQVNRQAQLLVQPRAVSAVSEDMPLAAALAAANGIAEWAEVRGCYRQCLALAADPDIGSIPVRLLESLGTAFDRLAPAYADEEEQFLVHAMATLLDVDGADRITHGRLDALYDDERFRRLVSFDGSAERPARPSPFETCVETIRRMRDLRTVHDAVQPMASSGVVGGSSSYARFNWVRGARSGRSGSDLDLVLVVNGAAQVVESARLIAGIPAVDRAAAETLAERASTFVESGYDDGRTVFSQKLLLWSDKQDQLLTWRPDGSSDYLLDLRIMTLPVLAWLLLADAARIERDLTGNWRSIRDYSDRSSYSEDHQRSFSGRNLRFSVTSDEVPGGVLRTTRAYFIDESDRFYPGTSQNLVLPLADCRWDGLGVVPMLSTFRNKITRRVAHERRAVPNEVLLTSLAHARSATFTSTVLAQING